MKIRILTILFLVIYVISVLAGCRSSTHMLQQQQGAQSPQTLPTNNQTTESLDPIEPTEYTFPTITTSTTEPTEPNPTEPPFTESDPNALTTDEIAQLQEFYAYRDPNSEEGPNYHNTALATGFNDRYYISFNYFFCNGDQTNWQETSMTDEEYEFIMANVRDADLPGMKYYRITRADMLEIFYMCFGITVENSAQAELQWTAYWDETDCYYTATDIPAWSVPEYTIVGGKHLENGTIEVYYTVPTGHYRDYVMILQPVDDGYHMLSNYEYVSNSTT